ncbi:uncharacterized protein SOCE26_001380 [Sorangium cellulosum]|uniref:Tetratricopeptide repeat protein n=1 Tax=Sorangium cellulosum TaxID=56 RepID=A0A2L0EHI7_SORCE|nr:hypothetical protein [Sorangium cellulosum]AUX38760.1 uncharacterized protein SOCE26_001380 [Sorangium cellulosum]
MTSGVASPNIQRLEDNVNPLRPSRRTLSGPLSGVLLGASALLSVRQVAAEESAAERLFREGRALLVEQRFAEACPKLEESLRLEPSLGTTLNLAFCHERLGNVATAWVGFQEALTTARTAGDAAREAFARSRLDALEPRVPWLRVRAAAGGAGADQLTILIDGAALDPVAWDKELPVDPGDHVVAAAHLGEIFWQTTVAMRESQRVDVDVPAAAPAEPAPATAPEPAQQTAAQRDGAREEASARSAEPRATGGLVYEAGVIAGYLWLEANKQEGCSGGAGSCDYDLSTDNLVVGATGFVGATPLERLDLGLRFLAGIHSHGALIALGPSASYRSGERFRLGTTLSFGAVTQTGDAWMSGGDPWNGSSSGYVETIRPGTSVPLEFTVGLSAELGMKLMDGPAGALFLQTTPLLLVGWRGVGLSLPLGAAYRWD